MTSFSDLLCPTCALFLDFDGTLVEIAAHPEGVIVPEGLNRTLQRLQQLLGGAVAVISGRPIAQIDDFLDPLVLCVAGVHGAERRRADGSLTWMAVPPLQQVEQAATQLARHHPGLRVETKRGSLALHYRQVPELEAQCLAAMQAAVDQSPGLALLRGKMVVEAKSRQASKGHAIEAYLGEPPFAGRKPVFIGDDVTDEAGFAAVQAAGGIGVKVGEGASVAAHRLANPAVMRDAMEQALARHPLPAGEVAR